MNRPSNLPVAVKTRPVPGRFSWWLGLVIAAVALTQVPAYAQFSSGSIGATVTDSTGAVIPGAKIVLKNEATGVTRDSITNNSGNFDFPSVLPGTYTVTVSGAGFETY